MNDLDPAALMDEHDGSGHYCGMDWHDEHDPCLIYRLAEALTAEQAKDEGGEFTEADHPEPPLVYWQWTRNRVPLAWWGNDASGRSVWGVLVDQPKQEES
jgi:hypothetical protein